VIGYIQMTPIPASHFEDNNPLDRMVKAIDGPDPDEIKRAWAAVEKDAFVEWSGLEDDFGFTILTGFPTKFAVFYGPWPRKDDPMEPIHEVINNFVSNLSADVVYGDTGCTLNDVSFNDRARWRIDEEGNDVDWKKRKRPTLRKEGVTEIGPTWNTLGSVILLTILMLGVLACLIHLM
jgi:hypothetical protein